MGGEARAERGDFDAAQSRFMCSGVRIDSIGPQAAVDALLESRYGDSRRVHLCNAYTLSLAVRDRGYRGLLNNSDFNFADGHYVAMVGRWRGQAELVQRVYGPTLMLATLDRGRVDGLRHYLYGTTPDTVTRLAAALADRFPGVSLVGVEAPPFRSLTVREEEELVERVSAAKPDILWVGLGTPRQDQFVARYTERLGCTVVPVGAAFDLHSGVKPGAPRFMQRIGMEWLFRLASEPIRLWRRYLFGIPVFMYGVAADHWWRWREAPSPNGSGQLPRSRVTPDLSPDRAEQQPQ